MKKITTWFKELSRLGKIAVVTAVLMVGGTMLNAAALPQTPVADTVEAEPKVVEKKPEVTTKTVEETKAVPFETQTVDDAGMASGTTSVRTEGVDGVRTISYDVTYTDGEETSRVQTSNEVTTPPVTKVIANGTYVAPKPKPAPVAASGCDPNYSGCVPVASDVDCANGSGNGPAYVAGPVQVIGVDIYDLDRNGDGWGCE